MNKYKSKSIGLSVCFILLLMIFPVFAQNGEKPKSNKTANSKVKNRIPKHLPLKVELINDDAEDILKDLEVKITNTGDKPIYFIHFMLSTLDVKAYNYPIAYSFVFGNPEFLDFDKLANPEINESLLPDDSYTFKLSPKHSENALNKKGLWEFTPFPNKFILEFQHLSFGDGTGFLNTSGIKYPIEAKS